MRSEKTRELYRGVIRRWAKEIGPDLKIEDLTLEHVQKFTDNLIAEKRKYSTIYTYITIIKKYLKFHGRKDLIPQVSMPKVPKEIRLHIKHHYWDDLFAALECDRDRALVAMMLGTGMRVGEALNIRLKDINWDEQHVHVPKAKGSKEVFYQMVLIEDLKEHVPRYIGGRKRGWLFPSGNPDRHIDERTVERIVKAAAIRAGVPDAKRITPHSLRHSLAIYLIWEMKWDVAVVKQVLNHEDISTTQIYTLADSEEINKFVKTHRPG